MRLACLIRLWRRTIKNRAESNLQIPLRRFGEPMTHSSGVSSVRGRQVIVTGQTIGLDGESGHTDAHGCLETVGEDGEGDTGGR